MNTPTEIATCRTGVRRSAGLDDDSDYAQARAMREEFHRSLARGAGIVLVVGIVIGVALSALLL